MPNVKILDLSLTYHWYDMIASGEKKEEYRDIKDFYFKRLNMDWKLHLEEGCYKGCTDFNWNKEGCVRCKCFQAFPYDAVRFHRGQGSRVTMLIQCLGIEIGYGKPEWGAPTDRPVFIIRLGQKIPKSFEKTCM